MQNILTILPLWLPLSQYPLVKSSGPIMWIVTNSPLMKRGMVAGAYYPAKSPFILKLPSTWLATDYSKPYPSTPTLSLLS